MATLQRRGKRQTEVTERQRRLRKRGQLFEQIVVEQLARTHGDLNLETQRPVHWPGGICHPDVFVIPDRQAIEIKSSTHPSGLMRDAQLQNAGQQYFDVDCDGGGLIFVDPVDLEMRYESVSYPDFAEEIEELVGTLAWAEHTGGLPDCSARSPHECRFAKFCQFTDLAWEGWTAPPPGELDDQELRDLLVAYYRLTQRRDELKPIEKAVKAELDDVKERLAAWDLAPGCEYQVGPLRVKRAHIAPADVSYTRQPYDRWYVDMRGHDPLPEPEVDYGEVPF